MVHGARGPRLSRVVVRDFGLLLMLRPIGESFFSPVSR
jgi:hypothetical protein